ncbi:MAG: diacylglycerol kinase [Planctomycetota bacterium]|nr:diacylglycerol kinase [Planctomycetota bacterium]
MSQPLLLVNTVDKPFPDKPWSPYHWSRKFVSSFEGILYSFRHHSSFYVHIPITISVILIAIFLEVALWEWITIILCIGMVLIAELFNTALETLARAITEQRNDHIRIALNIAAGAVLLASLTATLSASLIIARHLLF